MWRPALVLLIAGMFPCFIGAEEPVRIATDIGVQWDFMQVVNSSNPNERNPVDTTWLNGLWMQSIKSILDVRADIGDKLSIGVRYYGRMAFTLPSAVESDVQKRSSSGGIDAANALYRFGGADTTALHMTLGYFPFEYTHPWQRLGGYLFKTGVYPGYVYNAYAETRLTGIRASLALPSSLRHDLFLTVETMQAPKYDISLTYLGRFFVERGFEVDVSCMLHRLLRTEQGNYDFTIRNGRYFYIDPAAGDTTFYRKAGIKAGARISADIKKIAGIGNRLGQNDLRLYGEAAVLGVVDFPGYYDEVLERIPVSAGLTLPAFGLLDVLGVEYEYYASRFKNNPMDNSAPVPYESFRPDESERWFAEIENPAAQDAGKRAHTDNHKWAAFAEKTFRDKLTLSAHAASDHFRAPSSSYYDQTERLHSPKEWYWQFSLKTRF